MFFVRTIAINVGYVESIIGKKNNPTIILFSQRFQTINFFYETSYKFLKHQQEIRRL